MEESETQNIRRPSVKMVYKGHRNSRTMVQLTYVSVHLEEKYSIVTAIDMNSDLKIKDFCLCMRERCDNLN